MELFWARQIAVLVSTSIKKCKVCNQKLNLVRTVVDSSTGNLLHMFECECGERTWED